MDAEGAAPRASRATTPRRAGRTLTATHVVDDDRNQLDRTRDEGTTDGGLDGERRAGVDVSATPTAVVQAAPVTADPANR